MPSSSPSRRYADILENIARIRLYLDGFDKAHFLADERTCDAVERCLMRVSEAAIKLGEAAEITAPHIPWRHIRGLGNVLRHAYDGVDPEILWNLITNDLEPLAKACQRAIQEIA